MLVLRNVRAAQIQKKDSFTLQIDRSEFKFTPDREDPWVDTILRNSLEVNEAKVSLFGTF